MPNIKAIVALIFYTNTWTELKIGEVSNLGKQGYGRQAYPFIAFSCMIF